MKIVWYYSCVFLVVSFGLIGCGSGGGTASGQLGTGGPGPFTDPVDFPLSGSARYNGSLTLDLPTPNGRNAFTGDLGLDVDFDATTAQVTGAAGSFVDPLNRSLAGRILITDGDLDRGANADEDYTFEASMNGTLRSSETRNLVITGTMLGDFNEVNSQVITGRVYGDVVSATGIDIFDGTFSATSDDP